MSVTIRDIALAAGVSIGTVSRALQNQRGCIGCVAGSLARALVLRQSTQLA